ncbi:MAG: DUF6916 family protein [Massilia sp.]
MKRRDILKVGSSALAVGALWTSSARAEGSAGFAWSSAAAAALVGQSFWLNHPQRGALALQLAGVQTGVASPGVDQFSLQFSSSETGIAAGTYDAEHPTIGHFAVFLAPASNKANNTLYRADFSLLT